MTGTLADAATLIADLRQTLAGPVITPREPEYDTVRHVAAGYSTVADGLVTDLEERIRQAYPGSTWERLAAVKARYDPHNVFRRNQNVAPTG